MRRNLKGTFSGIHNGDFLKRSGEATDLPDEWLKIGGNHTTRWEFRQDPMERPVLEIRHSADIRAGIIQTHEASLDLGQDEDWLVIILLKSEKPESKAYLRCYPMKSKGDVCKPWTYSFSPEQKLEKFKQVISGGSDIRFMRIETGIVGPGSLGIYQLIAYPILPNYMRRRAKKVSNELRQINHIQSIGEITKPIQLAMPIPLRVPVTVQATVDANVRNLTPTRDRVQIFGSSPVPLATSNSGRAQVEISGHGFNESLEEVTANQTLASTTTRDVSGLPRFSFAVYNFGTYRAFVQAELSPDGVHWVVEGSQREVGPGKLVIIPSGIFLRYTRLAYGAEGLTTLRIWVQAQS